MKSITAAQWLTNIAITVVGVLPVALMLATWTDLAIWQVVCVWLGINFLSAVINVCADRGWYTPSAGQRAAIRRASAREDALRGRLRDAGHSTVGHALGVALVLGAFLLLLGLAGAVETGGAW